MGPGLPNSELCDGSAALVRYSFVKLIIYYLIITKNVKLIIFISVLWVRQFLERVMAVCHKTQKSENLRNGRMPKDTHRQT
jgi:hypothetical protein